MFQLRDLRHLTQYKMERVPILEKKDEELLLLKDDFQEKTAVLCCIDRKCLKLRCERKSIQFFFYIQFFY